MFFWRVWEKKCEGNFGAKILANWVVTGCAQAIPREGEAKQEHGRHAINAAYKGGGHGCGARRKLPRRICWAREQSAEGGPGDQLQAMAAVEEALRFEPRVLAFGELQSAEERGQALDLLFGSLLDPYLREPYPSEISEVIKEWLLERGDHQADELAWMLIWAQLQLCLKRRILRRSPVTTMFMLQTLSGGSG